MHEPFRSLSSSVLHKADALDLSKLDGAELDLPKAVQYARRVQGELRPDDPRLDHTVHLACKDGMNLSLPHAFVETAGDWVCVFTRDHGYFVEPKDSLAACSTTERHPR